MHSRQYGKLPIIIHPTPFSNTELNRKDFFQPGKDQSQEKPGPLQLRHPVERLTVTKSKLNYNIILTPCLPPWGFQLLSAYRSRVGKEKEMSLHLQS